MYRGRVALNARVSTALFAGTLAAGCAGGAATPGAHEALSATVWTATSAEYAAVTRQVYASATRALERALADPSWSALDERGPGGRGLPPAVMLDLDETVISTASYQASLVVSGQGHTRAAFREWCEENPGEAVPGARQFLSRAAELDVAVYYFSARGEDLRACTLRSLRALGFPLDASGRSVLLGGEKAARRGWVGERYRVLLIVGDNLDDFVSGSRANPAARRALAERHRRRWGEQWFVVPNPIYGHWEGAFFEFDYRAPRAERAERMRRGLLDASP